ncbi:FkbM family methyltransferase [Alkalicaulis satelles]|uniref:FkbM family methyltransferase n=1 Tax=Alkalicaulis satelles TaxID=2609175 RepID=A0A5M6ZDU8_9PROT|nr:FkbM family methyltransferase [Alkalicaulis satelles]KAA5802400.1 FkbM family methyltransferase [Alkalicaulis satelles]
MVSLPDFRQYALANKMELEAILSEVYGALMAGQSGFLMVDGGAHKGYHTLRMLDLPGCKRVVAVEADPDMASRLESILNRQAAGDPRLRIVRKALQRDPSLTRIAWGSSTSHEGRSSILSGNDQRPTIWHGNTDMAYRETVFVDAATLDQVLISERLPVGFIKLDLEGADLHALFGARDTLAQHRPVVAFENSVHAPQVHGFTIGEVAAYFHGLGYVALDFTGEPMTPDSWFGFFEAFAAPREQVQALSGILKAALSKRNL